MATRADSKIGLSVRDRKNLQRVFKVCLLHFFIVYQAGSWELKFKMNGLFFWLLNKIFVYLTFEENLA